GGRAEACTAEEACQDTAGKGRPDGWRQPGHDCQAGKSANARACNSAAKRAFLCLAAHVSRLETRLALSRVRTPNWSAANPRCCRSSTAASAWPRSWKRPTTVERLLAVIALLSSLAGAYQTCSADGQKCKSSAIR